MSGDLRDVWIDDGYTFDSIGNFWLKLLGVHCGQFSETVQATLPRSDKSGEAFEPISEQHDHSRTILAHLRAFGCTYYGRQATQKR
jgi:hypothetical protein